jgi:Chalcone isomerase-like
MKLMLVKCLLLLVCWTSVIAADVTIEASRGVYLKKDIAFEYDGSETGMSLTGFTVRKKLFLKIYSMAHYVEQAPKGIVKSEDIYNYILQQGGAKQISMVFLRSLSAEQIRESLISGIKKNTNEDEYVQILPSVEVFMKSISEDVEEKDEFVLRWLPNGTIISLFQGKEISSIKDENFARTLWSIWFGDYSVIDRNKLIKELLTSS